VRPSRPSDSLIPRSVPGRVLLAHPDVRTGHREHLQQAVDVECHRRQADGSLAFRLAQGSPRHPVVAAGRLLPGVPDLLADAEVHLQPPVLVLRDRRCRRGELASARGKTERAPPGPLVLPRSQLAAMPDRGPGDERQGEQLEAAVLVLRQRGRGNGAAAGYRVAQRCPARPVRVRVVLPVMPHRMVQRGHDDLQAAAHVGCHGDPVQLMPVRGCAQGPPGGRPGVPDVVGHFLGDPDVGGELRVVWSRPGNGRDDQPPVTISRDSEMPYFRHGDTHPSRASRKWQADNAPAPARICGPAVTVARLYAPPTMMRATCQLVSALLSPSVPSTKTRHQMCVKGVKFPHTLEPDAIT
jgi:hypothetical protein